MYLDVRKLTDIKERETMKKLLFGLILLIWSVVPVLAGPGSIVLMELDLSSGWQDYAGDDGIAVLWRTDTLALLGISKNAPDSFVYTCPGLRYMATLEKNERVFVLVRDATDWPAGRRNPVAVLSTGYEIYILPEGKSPPEEYGFFIRLPQWGRGLESLLPKQYMGRSPRDHDPAIQALVDSVNQSSQYTYLDTLCNFTTRYSYTQGCINAVNYAADFFDDLGLSVEIVPHTGGMAGNVIATQTGMINPDRIWIVGGHVDSTSNQPETLAPGADDNGTGSVLTMHVAEILHQQLFEDTIIYALWTGEEQGLYGSTAWAADAAAQGLDIQGYYNFDMVGWTDPEPEDLDVIVNTNSQQFGQDFIAATNLYTTLPTVFTVDSTMQYSDHYPFWTQGYFSFCGIEDCWPIYPYYHTTQDTIDKVDFNFLGDCTRATIGAVCTAAGLLPGEIILVDREIDDSSGDGDGAVDPGETVDLIVTLKNYTQDTVANVQCELIPTFGGEWITMIDGTSNFGDMANYAESDNSADPFVFMASPATPEDTSVSFNLVITGDGGYSHTIPFDVTVTTRYFMCPIYSWDMSLNPGWETQGQWAWGQPTGGSGDHGGPDPTSGYTGNNVLGYNLNGGYTNDMPAYHLTAGPFDFTGIYDAELHFARWLGVESATYDHAKISVSINGTTFTTIWENGTTTIDDTSWQQVSYLLGSQVDNRPSVWIRWTMGNTDGGWTYCGWNIDDVSICGYRYQTPDPTQTPPPQPTNTALPTWTPVPPTSTAQAPTHTPGYPTQTPQPPTETPSVPTNTPSQATATPIPPTNTALPTWTSVPPTDTPVVNTPTPMVSSPTPSENTPTPFPPTATPSCTQLGATIWMPEHFYTPGTNCACLVTICNPGPETHEQLPLFVILDIMGSLFFAPSWTGFDFTLVDCPPGEQTMNVLPVFSWPEGAGSFDGAVFYAALTDPDITQLIGDWDMWSFGWGE